MGKVVTIFKVTMAIFEKAKGVVTSIPSNYQDNFNNKLAEVTKLRDKAVSENKSIYFEREISITEL